MTEYLARVVVPPQLRGGQSKSCLFSRCSSSTPRLSSSSSHSCLLFVSSFDFSGLLCHGPLGFHGAHGIRQQGICAGRAHGQAPRLEPCTSALKGGQLTENVQVLPRSPQERGKVLAVVAIAVVTASAAVVAAAVDFSAVDATEIGSPWGDRRFRGVASPPPPHPAPASGSSAGALRGVSSTGGYTSVMSRSDFATPPFSRAAPRLCGRKCSGRR